MAGQLLVSQPWGCEARLRGRTAIPAEFARQGQAREVTDLAPDEVAATAGRAASLVAAAGLAIGLGALPVLVAIAPGAGRWLAVGAGGLVAVAGGGKLAAGGGGRGARFEADSTLRVAAAPID